MSLARAPQPRRVPPPPPPPPRSSNFASHDPEEPPNSGIISLKARIASLQIEQVGRGDPAKPPIPSRRTSHDIPPIPPRRENTGAPQKPTTGPAPDLARLLARRPPPPPIRGGLPAAATPTLPSPTTPVPPQRRLPPMPARLPTPPPVNLSSKPQLSTLPEPELDPYDSQLACLKCCDFSHVDSHAAMFPRHTVSSLQSLAYDLTEPFESETEKARSIFVWLHHNISYDTESFFSGNIQPATPESTLASGLAVCDGYAGFFKFLAECVGMQVHKVIGHGKGIGYQATGPGEPTPAFQMNHAWNCIFMDGLWWLVDSCWGAGAVNGTEYDQRFAPVWFTSTPAEFGRRHFPEDLSFQLLSEEEGGAISWEEYILEPPGPTVFRDFHQLDLLADSLQPSTNEILGGQYITFSVFKRCAHMSTADADNFVYIIVTNDSKTPLVLNQEGGWSADVYVPRGGEVKLYSVTTVNGQDAVGLGANGFNIANGRKGMSFGGLAKWTVI